MTDKHHDTRQPRNTRQEQERRKGGEKGADGHAPGEWRRQEERHGEEHGRTDGNRERREKEYVIFKGEKREKRR